MFKSEDKGLFDFYSNVFVRKETAADRRHRKNIYVPNTRSVLVRHNRTLDSLTQARSGAEVEKSMPCFPQP